MIGWQDVTIIEFLDILDIINNDGSILGKNIQLYEYITGDSADDKSSKEILTWGKQNAWLFDLPRDQHKEMIGEYHLLPLMKISLGAWIDAQKYLDNNEEYKLIPLLYRRKKQDEWGNELWEPYVYKVDDRLEQIEDFAIGDVYGVINVYKKFHENVLKSYHQVFENKEEEFEATEEEKNLLSEAEIQQIKQDVKKNQIKQSMSWQHLIYNLTNGDLTKSEKILELPAIYVFNMLLMKKVFEI